MIEAFSEHICSESDGQAVHISLYSSVFLMFINNTEKPHYYIFCSKYNPTFQSSAILNLGFVHILIFLPDERYVLHKIIFIVFLLLTLVGIKVWLYSLAVKIFLDLCKTIKFILKSGLKPKPFFSPHSKYSGLQQHVV